MFKCVFYMRVLLYDLIMIYIIINMHLLICRALLGLARGP